MGSKLCDANKNSGKLSLFTAPSLADSDTCLPSWCLNTHIFEVFLPDFHSNYYTSCNPHNNVNVHILELHRTKVLAGCTGELEAAVPFCTSLRGVTHLVLCMKERGAPCRCAAQRLKWKEQWGLGTWIPVAAPHKPRDREHVVLFLWTVSFRLYS